MAEKSSIAWTDSTFNPWIGCTKVGPGCDHCYAEALDTQRYSKTLGGGTKAIPITHWGPGAPRHRTKTWAQPLAWNEKARASGKPWRVFCASLADFADNEVPQAWRDDLIRLIDNTPCLSWLLVTKRIGNVGHLYPGWDTGAVPLNVRIMITVVNQEEADRDIPKLLALRCMSGISYEPALGPVNWEKYLWRQMALNEIPGHALNDGCTSGIARRKGGWIIVGGESSQGREPARMFDVWWARDTIAQCKAAGVPVFVKQLGNAVAFRNSPWELPGKPGDRPREAWNDPAEWPADLRVQEFPA